MVVAVLVGKKLGRKIEAYKLSLVTSDREDRDYGKACRELERQLGIERVEPREYRFLHGIAESLQRNERVDLKKLASDAGYPRWMCAKPETAILRGIDDKLFDAILGIDRKLIQRELRKMVEQDGDSTAKMRAIELASRIMGMQDGDSTKIQINFPSSVELSD
jgi:hypothetical protein